MGKYDDIIDLPAFKAKGRKQMSLSDRAAQFAPFKSLSGYGDELTETARVTDGKAELSDDRKDELDIMLRRILSGEISEIGITYFVKDEKKSGGRYEKRRGEVRFVDTVMRRIVFADGFQVCLDDISEISGYQ